LNVKTLGQRSVCVCVSVCVVSEDILNVDNRDEITTCWKRWEDHVEMSVKLLA